MLLVFMSSHGSHDIDFTFKLYVYQEVHIVGLCKQMPFPTPRIVLSGLCLLMVISHPNVRVQSCC